MESEPSNRVILIYLPYMFITTIAELSKNVLDQKRKRKKDAERKEKVTRIKHHLQLLMHLGIF